MVEKIEFKKEETLPEVDVAAEADVVAVVAKPETEKKSRKTAQNLTDFIAW